MILNITATSLDPNGNGAPTKHKFSKSEIVIGRLPTCDLPLTDSTISATHAKLSITNDPVSGAPRVYIEDLGSSNGTSVEHIRLSPFARMPIEPEQWVRTGQYLIKAVLDTTSEEELRSSLGAYLYSREDLGLSAHIEGNCEVLSTLQTLSSHMIVEDEPAYEPEEVKTPARCTTEIEEEVALIDVTQESEHQIIKESLTTNDITDLNFEAFRIVIIQGTAYSRDGSPLAGVTISGGSLGTTYTNDEGHFSFGPVREGTEYELSASLVGFDFESDKISGKACQDPKLEFQVKKTFSVSGSVLSDGSPVADVEIDAGQFGKVFTDADGRYVICGIPPHTELELKASKEGYCFNRLIKKT